MKTNYALYHLYNSILMQTMRLIVFLVLAVLIGLTFTQGAFPKFPLFFFSLFLMNEIFFQYKIANAHPHVHASDNDGSNPYTSFTLPAANIALFASTPFEGITHLLKFQQIQFMLHKANLNAQEITNINMSLTKDDWAKKALELAQNATGDFVTTMDLFAAYVVLTEQQTKFLFTKSLKEDEFLHILYWARADFPQEEHPPKKRVTFWGEGIGEEWVAGWTYETNKYVTNFTAKVITERPTLVGREKEYAQLVEILSKSTKSNCLLVGEPGTGRTSLVEKLAVNSFSGLVGGSLYHKRFYELVLVTLLAGTNAPGLLEQRLQSIFDELAHAGNILIFMPELQNIVGASGFHTDLSGALLPHLQNGAIRVVATITPGAYKQYVEPLQSFSDVFEIITLEEPTREETIQMMLEKAHELESKYRVSFTYRSIISAVDLSKRYIQDHALPGSAVSLLSLVAASSMYAGKKIVDVPDVIAKVEQRTHVAIAAPGEHERDLLLHLEDKLHERIVDQEEGVAQIAEAVRRFRTGLTETTRPISFLFLGPTGVGKTETAKALASLYFGGEDKIIRLDMSEYTGIDAVRRLLGSAPGQGYEKGELTDKIHEHPFSLVLLDEFEKAHLEVLNLFLQVLEDGRLTDNKGRTVSFANAMIIATSNAGSEFIREEIQKGTRIDKTFQKKLLDLLETQNIFKPELLNRFDGIIAFKPLGEAEVIAITKLLLNKVLQQLRNQEIFVSFDDSVVAQVAKQGFDQEFGARPLRRYIQDNIEDILARKMLEEEIGRGTHLAVLVDTSGKLVITTKQTI